MKKIVVLFFVIIGIYLIYTRLNRHKGFFEKPQSGVSINDLRRSSIFVDSLVELHDVTIIESKILLRYSQSTITDKSQETITLLTDKPYRVNETINTIRGRYIIIYDDSKTHYDVFVSESLKPSGNLISMLRQTLL